ncbi:MAG: lycopene cyclase domain-containing protein [Actinobacteria bacterium]|nr:lycopene cyclase domain-containing protein [Actinomycetota bacterium]MCG2802010.1 lycopene cyclase domain-containing protein [Cellulomonas sp.]
MTNLVLNLLVLAVLLAVSLPVLRRLRVWPVVGAVVVLCALTVVFDTLMIRVGLYVFDPAKILGVRVWGAPLEDFAYAVAAGVAMPVLWTVLGRRARVRTADGEGR